MKDIENNNCDLEKEIDNYNEEFNYKREVRSQLLIGGCALAIALGGVFGLDILDFNLANFAWTAGISVGVLGSTSAVYLAQKKKSIETRNNEADYNMECVINNLDKNGLTTDKDRVKETITEVDTITQSNTRNSYNEIMSKEEKIIKYFYLLDSEDQIRVLKQISLATTKDGESQNRHSLSLMEEEDLKDVKIPVYKTLKLKKDME